MGGSNGHSDELSCGEMYNPNLDEWTQVPELRTNRCNAGVRRSEGRHFTSLFASLGYIFTRFICFALGVCSLNNKLYVVGGSDPCGQKGLKNCDTFDPVTKEWTSCASLNISECLSPFHGYLVWSRICRSVSDVRVFICAGRHQAAVCELDGYMYVIGGAESWNCLNSVERYNPENNTWTLVAPMNVARRGAGVGIYAGKMEKMLERGRLPCKNGGVSV